MLILPPSSADMAMGKPWPSSPNSWSARKRISSKDSETVVEARRPILSSCLPTRSPGCPPSTRKAEIPREPLSGRVRAHTMISPAWSPEVIHCFSPSRIQPFPSRRAEVRSAAASDPPEGSDSAKLPAMNRPLVSSGTYRRFCSGVPNFTTVSATMLVTATVTAVEAQPCAISIIASAYATAPACAPPNCSSTLTPISPSSASSRSCAAGKRPSRSSCAATLTSDSWAYFRAVSCTRRWCSSGWNMGRGHYRQVAAGRSKKGRRRSLLVGADRNRRRRPGPRDDPVHLLELQRERRELLAKQRPVDEDSVARHEAELACDGEPLVGERPPGVTVLVHDADADEVVDGVRERGMPARQPPFERIRFPIPRRERDDVADVHVDVGDSRAAAAEQQRRQKRSAEHLLRRQPLRQISAWRPTLALRCPLNGHVTPPVVPGSPQQCIRNDQPLDLAGPLVDLRDSRVAEMALDVQLLRVAHPAVDLDRLVGDAVRRFRSEQLRHARLARIPAARILHARRAKLAHPRRRPVRCPVV